MQDRMKVFHDLCEENGFLDYFEKLNQKLLVIFHLDSDERESHSVLRGEDKDLEKEYQAWIIAQIGPNPIGGMKYEDFLKSAISPHSQIKEYWKKRRGLKIEDFIATLNGYEQLPFKIVDCY